MKFHKTKLMGLYIIELEPFQDDRGEFYRVLCKNELNEIGHKKEIVQINFSKTLRKGAIRGMHFQYPPKSEIKIVKCLKGSIYDVAVDLRKNSPTLLQWHGEVLNTKNFKMMYIPEGFAHGFQALEDNVEVIYFVTEFYSPESEGGVKYDDPIINIQWPLEVTLISQKDKNLKLLDNTFEGI